MANELSLMRPCTDMIADDWPFTFQNDVETTLIICQYFIYFILFYFYLIICKFILIWVMSFCTFYLSSLSLIVNKHHSRYISILCSFVMVLKGQKRQRQLHGRWACQFPCNNFCVAESPLLRL